MEEAEEGAGAVMAVALRVAMGAPAPTLLTRGAGGRSLSPTAACRAGRKVRRGSGRPPGGAADAQVGEVAAAGVRL